MLVVLLLLSLPSVALYGAFLPKEIQQKITDSARAKAEELAKGLDQNSQKTQNLPNMLRSPDTNITYTYVNITNRSDKNVSFVLSAIHTTQEKTNMYSRKYNAYLTQSVITDPAAAAPMQTVTLSVNKAGLDLAQTEKIFGIVVFAAQSGYTTESVKKTCADGKVLRYPELSPTQVPGSIPVVETDMYNQPRKDSAGNPIVKGYITQAQLKTLEMPSYMYDKGYIATTAIHNRITSAGVQVCQVFDYEITFTEHMDTFMSNPKAKQITLKTAQNFFDFPQDFVFNAKTERKYHSPNADRIIQDLKAVEDKYNRAMFPPQYFNKDFVRRLPQEEITHLIAYATKLLKEPVPIRQATLGTLLDCGKYNGIAAALVKIAIAIVMFITGGSAAALVMDSVDSGMNFATEIQNAVARS